MPLSGLEAGGPCIGMGMEPGMGMVPGPVSVDPATMNNSIAIHGMLLQKTHRWPFVNTNQHTHTPLYVYGTHHDVIMVSL